MDASKVLQLQYHSVFQKSNWEILLTPLLIKKHSAPSRKAQFSIIENK